MNNPETFLGGKVQLLTGDCVEVLKGIPADSIDSCVTDPPYHLVQNSRRGSSQPGDLETPYGRSGPSRARGRGFMGREWDGGDVAFRPETWAEVYRVLKPGAHLVAFSGTRTYHRMACAIEDAGFEIRDQIGWLYGSGFPKSRNLDGDWNGWGTALKPAWEPIVLARKPLIGTVAENVLQHGTGALNIDGCRVATGDDLNGGAYTGSQRHDGTENWRFRNGGARQPMPGDERQGAALGMFQPGKTAGRGYTQPPGRWPANIVHDGSEEVVGAFPESDGCQPHQIHSANAKYDGWGSITNKSGETVGYKGSGSAARFFYTAKADSNDRLGSKHPTVKPLDLMQWLVRLVTPPGGLVLDLFAGTGTTGEAAFREGARAILIEREEEYCNDIRRRMRCAMAGPEERRREIIKTTGKAEDAGPLFGGT